MNELLGEQKDLVVEAAGLAKKARVQEGRSKYDLALEYAKQAEAIDGEVHADLLKYIKAIRGGRALAKNEKWIRAINLLHKARSLVESPQGADRELDRATRNGVRHFEHRARDKSLPLVDRLSAIMALDTVTDLIGTRTNARALERSMVSALPQAQVRYDLARTHNDMGSKLYRIVQDKLREHGRSYRAQVELVDVLDHMAAYEGQEGRALGSGEVFLVQVDVIDFNSSVERDRDTLEEEYVSGYRIERYRNAEFDRWRQWYKDNCENSTATEDWQIALNATACIAHLGNRPPEIIEEKIPQYSTCRYRVTNHNLYGRAEVQVEMFHVPDGETYMDHVFSKQIQDVKTEVEQISGDCKAAGVRLKSLKRSPTSKDVEYPMVEQIEQEIDQVLKETLRPTNVVSWLSNTYPERPELKDYALGAVHAEGGLEAVYKHFGLKRIETASRGD